MYMNERDSKIQAKMVETAHTENVGRLSLKLRLNLIITCILLFAMMIGAYFLVENAREDVRAELDSTASLALHLLDAEISQLHQIETQRFASGRTASGQPVQTTTGWTQANWKKDAAKITHPQFKLGSLGNIRHLQIDFVDQTGHLLESNRATTLNNARAKPPAWFVKAVGITALQQPSIRREVVFDGNPVGELVVTPDPSYEISEIWEDTTSMLGLVAVFFVFVNILVYWAVNRAFKPVDKILAALTQLEQGKLEARLTQFDQPELARIAVKFNAMAETLQQSVRSNHLLTQQLIHLQEVERKNLARDIHDEIGQYLTAINVDATAIQHSRSLKAARESAEAIGWVTRQMMDIVHDLLQRLRPGVLDELGLGLALIDLVDSWKTRNRKISTAVTIPADLGELSETCAVAAYRGVQECLTNITRHAEASRMTIRVNRKANQLHILIEDNGKGYNPASAGKGYGLAGLRERVHGLFGSVSIEPLLDSSGTRVSLQIPCLEAIPA